ncbi:transglutaminase family protein [Enterovirga rhinocerotis]|uniref:Transglutaminase-like putative cysteine protease n=1 Tax=Enterovirga rhinocerotis TaxID=1339210 RepID=A0A4V3DYS8_9HYPH|nr:transglutaminase family protein [Enterovirga rhinocerotis]TDR93809.1 transglutaminase-like putative cysteine protease [Enterovirga rhinocerotis]
MISLHIRHATTYRYRHPVSLGPHRLMLRPRETREVRLPIYTLTIRPEPDLVWASDVAGNAVATATFSEPSDHLVIESLARVELSAAAYPVFRIAADAISFPFRYQSDDWADLGSLTVRRYLDQGELRAWAQSFVSSNPTDTLSLLKDLNAGVAMSAVYSARENEGTQSPSETLALKSGSCRDLATLFVEAARSLGFGARIVSGYLHDPTRTLLGSADSGSTHAWAEIYLSGAGWITFDPTNRAMGGANLIPVAVAQDVRQIVPITGSFVGAASAFQSMDVAVSVTECA